MGDIPAGKFDVLIRLTANSDVDVQLYDFKATERFPEGDAVVAWCADAETCNIGALGSDEGAKTTNYKVSFVFFGLMGGHNLQTITANRYI